MKWTIKRDFVLLQFYITMAGRSLFYLGNSWICSMPKKNLLNLKSANEFRKLKLLTPEWKHGSFYRTESFVYYVWKGYEWISITGSLWECSLYVTSPNLFASRTTCALHCKLLVSPLLVQQLPILAFPFLCSIITQCHVFGTIEPSIMQCVQAPICPCKYYWVWPRDSQSMISLKAYGEILW